MCLYHNNDDCNVDGSAGNDDDDDDDDDVFVINLRSYIETLTSRIHI